MTPFRRSQARAVLEGVVRSLAPQMCSRDGLYLAVCELAQDRRLWAELDVLRAQLAAAQKPISAEPPSPT